MIVCEMRAMVRAAKGRLSISFRSGHADCVRWPRVRVATRDYEKNIIGGLRESTWKASIFSISCALNYYIFPPDINAVIFYVIIVMIWKKNKLKPHIIYVKPHNRQ